METYSILVNANDEAIRDITYSAETDVTAPALGCSLLSETYLTQYIANNAGVDTVADALTDLGITDLREVE